MNYNPANHLSASKIEQGFTYIPFSNLKSGVISVASGFADYGFENGHPRIHYACGRNILPGWVNADNVSSGDFPFGFLNKLESIYNVDLLRAHPFPAEIWQYAFAEDFIEHLTQHQFYLFASEAARTLRPSGILALSFPCWEGVFEQHLREDSEIGLPSYWTDWNHKHLPSRQFVLDVMHMLDLVPVPGFSLKAAASNFPWSRSNQTWNARMLFAKRR